VVICGNTIPVIWIGGNGETASLLDTREGVDALEFAPTHHTFTVKFDVLCAPMTDELEIVAAVGDGFGVEAVLRAFVVVHGYDHDSSQPP
jgi:hypothetical protein